MCEAWKMSQMEARSTLLQQMSASAQEVVQRVLQGPGDAPSVSELRAEIEAAWRGDLSGHAGAVQARMPSAFRPLRNARSTGIWNGANW